MPGPSGPHRHGAVTGRTPERTPPETPYRTPPEPEPHHTRPSGTGRPGEAPYAPPEPESDRNPGTRTGTGNLPGTGHRSRTRT